VTEAEKWRTLARILALTVPTGTLIGFALGWLTVHPSRRGRYRARA